MKSVQAIAPCAEEQGNLSVDHLELTRFSLPVQTIPTQL